MKPKLYDFHGGMHLRDHKTASLTRGLQQASLPAQLFLPLKQHIGEYNKALVDVGDQVFKGQIIAASASPICAPVHAPSSGVVSAIDHFPVAHPSGQADTCIVIDTDGKDQPGPAPGLNLTDSSPAEMMDSICRAGIVGLGGGAFPTTAKLSRANTQAVDTLIINGVECEPYITCDDMLMRVYAAEVIRGVGYLQRILPTKITLLGIEDNKPDAIAAMRQALLDHPLENTEIIDIPTKYPAGGEKQLIQILTGKEVPRSGLAFDIGILCQNVGTCVAITRALEQGEPLISRVVTVSGDNIRYPGNWEVRLGTPVSHLIELAGGYLEHSSHLVMGGPMMGFSLSSARVPIVKASNNILVMREQAIPQTPWYHDECIRCSKCTEVCPAQLLPQQLYWHARAKSYDRTQEFNLFECIECGCCSAVCPSQIPLVQYYRAAKSEIRAAQKSQTKSDYARLRFEFREQRLLLKKEKDEDRKRLKREALQKKRPELKKGDQVDPVQAALERVKARKKALEEESR